MVQRPFFSLLFSRFIYFFLYLFFCFCTRPARGSGKWLLSLWWHPGRIKMSWGRFKFSTNQSVYRLVIKVTVNWKLMLVRTTKANCRAQINKTCWKIVKSLVANQQYASFSLVISIFEKRWGIRYVHASAYAVCAPYFILPRITHAKHGIGTSANLTSEAQ